MAGCSGYCPARADGSCQGHSTIHDQLETIDVSVFVGHKIQRCVSHPVGRRECVRSWYEGTRDAPSVTPSFSMIEVSTGPGLSTLTRTRRCLNSKAQLRANDASGVCRWGVALATSADTKAEPRRGWNPRSYAVGAHSGTSKRSTGRVHCMDWRREAPLRRTGLPRPHTVEAILGPAATSTAECPLPPPITGRLSPHCVRRRPLSSPPVHLRPQVLARTEVNLGKK